MIGQIVPTTPWERARLGRFTSSEAHRLLTAGKRLMTPEELAARPKKGEGSATKYVEDYSVLSDGAQTYVREKASEIRTGTIRMMENYATDWGKMQEPNAIEKLKVQFPDIIHYGTENQQFFKYTQFSGGSPDAECKNVCFEIKCPENPANHEEYMDIENQEDLKSHKDHYAQLQMNMAIVGKKNGIDFKDMVGVFASYDPRYPEDMQLHTVVVAPDMAFIENLNRALESAELALADRIAKSPSPVTVAA